MPASDPAQTAALSPAAVDGRSALGWMHTARFLTTAAQLHQLPVVDVPEIAFVGRSNAGKSSCINTLTQQKQLAFASKKPGRTQHINLFSLGRQNTTDAVLADLAPQHRGGEDEHREARQHREVDAQVQLAHQSCAFANT